MAAAPVLENFLRKLLAPEIFYLDSATFTEEKVAYSAGRYDVYNLNFV